MEREEAETVGREYEEVEATAREGAQAEATEVVVIRCPRCNTENTGDSVYCKNCAMWLVHRWESVLVKGRGPLSILFKVPPGRPFTTFGRQISLRQRITGTMEITGARRDILFYVLDPNGNVVAGNYPERVRRECNFEFTAYVPGQYVLTFDNSFSRFSTKTVNLMISGL